jgi:hypothetical protein
MLVSRRKFLQLILGTAPAVALSGPLAALWPDEAKSRPIADPVTLYLDRDWIPGTAVVVDDLDANAPAKEPLPPRREYFDWETLSLKERVEFWRDGWGARADDVEFLWDLPAVEDWGAEDLAKFNAFEADKDGWLDGSFDGDELSDLDLTHVTRFWAGYELCDHLGGKRARALGLSQAYFGSPGGGGWCVAFRGDLEKLNAALAALAINVVVLDPYADDEEDDDEWLSGDASA